ncbi:helix-turn-helix domain-containing protein [Actinomarinicola tropica]|uniref:Helix-turn-helix domain-containing protein n=1 Tax=Actinomarinicola tropica TaxID=2789776 RepID=A0A5Q2RNZ2_9ACTN|nr:helix-turn-helix domain-containing protein [Actinomarinicola tropica]QGG95817.1 helix-turn-helix domain-containing protein [Actinomarinicola tropica]
MSRFLDEPLGRRLARLRVARGHTQQSVAERLGLSRNAVSHLETGLSHPSERTVVLLAGLFGIEPHDLVAGTDYPPAKVDRLPAVAPRHTEVAARLLALDLELRWVDALPPASRADALTTILAELDDLGVRGVVDERAALDRARAAVSRRLREVGSASA